MNGRGTAGSGARRFAVLALAAAVLARPGRWALRRLLLHGANTVVRDERRR